MTQSGEAEFDRQVAVLIDAGVPGCAGLTTADFADVVAPLRSTAAGLEPQPDPLDGHVPWVLVVSPALVTAESLVPLIRLTGSGRPGVIDRNHGEDPLSGYLPLPELDVPDSPAYLVIDVDRGDEFRSVRPRDAVPVIRDRGRTPLTIHEGIALALQWPRILAPNHCFMLAGSRRGDRRVPALWISQRAPKLGWCWEGNHHTWLGIASAGGRVAAREQLAPSVS